MGSLEPGLFRYVLTDRSKIVAVLLDAACLQPDREFYRSVERLDQFAWIEGGQNIANVENFLGTRVCSFADWLEACEAYMEKVTAMGIAAFKNSLAYRRSSSMSCCSPTTVSRGKTGYSTLGRTSRTTWFTSA